jgi:hypothetical protein
LKDDFQNQGSPVVVAFFSLVAVLVAVCFRSAPVAIANFILCSSAGPCSAIEVRSKFLHFRRHEASHDVGIDFDLALSDNREKEDAVTIEVDLNPQTQALLAAQAAAHQMDLRMYAATLLERAASETASSGSDHRPSERKSLARLFADSPFKGLDLDFERDSDLGRDLAL